MPWRAEGRSIWMADFWVDGLRVRTSTRTPDKQAATQIELALQETAEVYHFRSVLQAVIDKQVHPHRFYRAFREQRLGGLIEELRQEAENPNLTLHIEPWQKHLEMRGVGAGRRNHYKLVVAHILTTKSEFLGDLQRPVIQDWIGELSTTFSAGTVRTYVAGLQSFFAYLTTQKLLAENDTRLKKKGRNGSGVGLELPRLARSLAHFLEVEQVGALIRKAPDEYVLSFAVAYGAGAEAGVLTQMRRHHFNVEAKEVRVRGTKLAHQPTNYRDRSVRVLNELWPTIEARIDGLSPNDFICPTRNRTKLSKIHYALCKQLEYKDFTLHEARHFWAVTMLRGGAPTIVVAKQLGHADDTMVKRVYGDYAPDGLEREKWADAASLAMKGRK